MRWNRAPASRRRPIGWHCSAETGPDRYFRCSPNGKWPTPFWIVWSRTLGDERERYLRQQIELGGSEVVLSRVLSRRVGGAEGRRESNSADLSARVAAAV